MNMWRELDLWLFGWMTPGNEVTWLTHTATWLAQWCSVWLLCVLLFALTQVPQRLYRFGLCLLVALLAQTLAHALARDWNTPRPFMLGLSANHLEHGTRGGLPSAHASVMFALAGAMWLTGTRGWLAMALATPVFLTSWARVYTGAHFPLDVLGGAALGMCVAWLCTWFSGAVSWWAINSSTRPTRVAVATSGDRT